MKIGVVGAGTMGARIAQVAALGGYDVILYDVAEDVTAKALASIRASIDKGVELGKTDPDAAGRAKAAFTLTTKLEDCAAADVVIEAAPEKLELKREIVAALSAEAAPDAVIATNTSSLSVSAIAAAAKNPERVVGMHFFNPAHIMRLVEVVRGQQTGDDVIEAALKLARDLGKTPVLCKDTPGFIANRVARPFSLEGLRLLGEGAADVETIDRLYRSLGFRMGPFELMDLIGIDINFTVSFTMFEAFFYEPKYRPHPIQKQMVDAGLLGRKTGRGFYEHEG
jgi:3-hydroxybutyryl-CoA dehydrogenase